MMLVTAIIDRVKHAPVSLLLSCFALAAFAIPELGHHLEFRFSDCQNSSPRVAASAVLMMTSSLMECCQAMRLIGCNWLHWSADHLFWDVLMFYGVGSVCEKDHWRSFLGTTVIAAILIPAIVCWASPELQSYRGLSGIDTALFALLATSRFIEATRQRQWGASLLFVAMLVGMIAKISLEMATQQVFFVNSDSFTPVPIAHLVGGAIGLLTACLVNFGSNSSQIGKSRTTGS